MSKKALIVSLKYHPGHYSHLIAYYLLLKEVGYESTLYVNKNFAKLDVDDAFNKLYKMTWLSYQKFDCVVFLFPSIKNILEIIKFRVFGSATIFYLFHEPIISYKEFYQSGFTGLSLAKLFFIDGVNKLSVTLSNSVILCSLKAFAIYETKYNLLNSHKLHIPLIFDDENQSKISINNERIYISYIGTLATDHAFDKFINYVEHAVSNDEFMNYKFLIATSSRLDKKLMRRLKSGDIRDRLVIVDGKWLSNQEINSFYSKSLVVWNAYDRSTQSGVLPKSFMFGTPVLGNYSLPNEYLRQYKNGIYLNDNSDYVEISEAIEYISTNIEELEFLVDLRS